MIDGCSERLQFKLDGWRSEYQEMMRADDGPALKDMVKLYHKGLNLIGCMRDELEQLRDNIVPATARFSQVQGHASNPGDPTGDIVVRIDILSREIDFLTQDIDCLGADIRWEIRYEVTALHWKDICRMRWLDRKPYAEIGKAVGYSESYCRAVICKVGKLTACRW